jgi:RNA polymerase sigma factor (sigma-70 family)
MPDVTFVTLVRPARYTCMDPETEPELVQRLRAGEPAAFDAIYAALNIRLLTFLVRLSRDRTVAEDLLEETWLRLVTHASRLRPDTQLLPWLFTVARNLHVSYCRSRMIEDTHAASLIGLWPFGSPRASPFEETAGNELERRLEAAIAALPERLREAVLLVAIEGIQPKEAAAICGITPEAMRQRVSRGRAALAEALDAPGAIKRTALEEATS